MRKTLGLLLTALLFWTNLSYGQTSVSISNLPVPNTGSTYLSTGDIVPATRSGTTYGLRVNSGNVICSSSQFVNAINAQGVPTCAQPQIAGIAGAGTAAAVNLGTSGSTLGLLNANLTFGGTDNFTGALEYNGNQVASTVSSPLVLTGTNITCPTCATTGGGGSLSATSPLVLTGNILSINNAAADGTTKGAAAFNATNFSASSGVVNTVQGISSAATPSFAGLTLTGNITLSTHNLVTDTTTGTDIGTATSQKVGFYGVTPIVQPAGAVLTALSNLGLIATPTLNFSALSGSATASQLPVATNSTQGIVQPDGTTITISAGTISALSSSLGVRGNFSALKGVWASTTTATWTANQIIVANASATPYLLSSYSQTINTAATVGTNTALDAGTLAASTWYYPYAIYGTNGTGIIFSASSTSPTLPSGYTYYARLGSFRTDGSSHIVGFIQYGREVNYVVGNNLANLPIVASGSTGSVTTPTYTSYSISSYAPTTASSVDMILFSYNNGNTAIAAPNGNYGAYESTTNPPPLQVGAQANGIAIQATARFLLQSTNVYYASNGSTYFILSGYEDNL